MVQNPRRSHHKKKPTLMTPNFKNSTTSLTNGIENLQNSGPNSMLPLPELENVSLLSELSEPTTTKSTQGPKKGTSGLSTSGGRDKYAKLNTLIVNQIGGFGLGMMGVPFLRKDGVVLFGHCQKLADSLVDCARVNEGLYKMLVSVFSGAVYTALVMETIAITGAIMANHNVQIPLPAALKDKMQAPDTSGYSFEAALMDGVKLAALLKSPAAEMDVTQLLAMAQAA